MKIVPISFYIASEDLTKSSPEAVEDSIRTEVILHLVDAIKPMLDNEGFINMTPREDESGFDIEINLLIGSTSELIDATSEVTTRLIKVTSAMGLVSSVQEEILTNTTQPLIDLIS